MNESHEEFRHLKAEMSKINPRRGGRASGLKGFYAESTNAAFDNLNRIDEGIGARQIVIDNNGDADAIIKYTNGQLGRKIQYKNGYSYSKHIEFLSSGKYDNMIYAVNSDNPIFDNPKQMEVLNALAKEHNIKLVQAKVSDREMQILADAACFEGGIRSSLSVEVSPKITLELYVDAKEVEYHLSKVVEKQALFNSYMVNQVNAFLDDDLARANSAGVDQALSAAQFASAMSVAKNLLNVIKDDEELKDVTINIIKDTSKAAVMGYATGVIAEGIGIEIGDAALLVNGTIQISNQLYAYINGDIDESRLVYNIAETSAYLTAAYVGKTIGRTIGLAAGSVGLLVGQFVGEMITTAVCSTVIETINKDKKINKYHYKMLALAHRAESEIRDSQDRLIILINDDNNRFIDSIRTGYEQFIDGILNNSYEEASLGLAHIGEGFGIDAEKLTRGHVTQGNIFGKKNRIVNIG